MARPTSIAQLRDVTQPPEVRTRRGAEHWTASLYLRNLSPYVTWVLLATPISANGVTVLMILTGWATAASLLIPGVAGAALAVVLGQLQMLIDCCDGEVARWRRTSSPAGQFLDAIGHYTTELLIAIALGVRAAAWPIETPSDYGWLLLGVLLALTLVMNKALNDLVRVARAGAGLDKVVSAAEAQASASGIAVVRRIVKFVPFHRMFHSVELTIVVFVASLIALAVGSPLTDRILIVALVIVAAITVAGHFVMIMASRRLRA